MSRLERELIVSTLQPLVIDTGADWGWTVTIKDAAGNPLNPTNLVLEMRRDLNLNAQLLIRLDMTGQAGGLISPSGSGQWSLTIAEAVTAQIPPGRGFWDLFGRLTGRATKLASGAVEVRPRVTAGLV
jgi:hypothetical protein